MSVALALLGIEKGCQFVYIGGDERTKGGLGQVVTGTERVFQGASPWQALAVAEQREGAAYFNQSQFAASAQCFARGLDMIRWQAGQAAVFLGILKELATGYDLWDRFQHKDARDRIKKAYATLETYAATTADREANLLSARVGGNLEFLDALMQQSYGFKRPCSLHLRDLLGNAERRAAEGRFDDGVIRLYRALELMEQLALQERGVDAGVEKLALQNGFLRLAELDNPLGKLFAQRKEDFQKVQQARNYSWLVHGTQVLKEDTYRHLNGLVLALAQISEAELPTFPRLGVG